MFYSQIFSDNTPMPCPDMDLCNVVSRQVMEESGWKFDVSPWDNHESVGICDNDTWYGFYNGRRMGSVSAHFKGYGFGILKFGNCWADNEVSVYLNSVKIDFALGNVINQEILFHFSPGDKLQVTEDTAIIKVHSLSIKCYGKYTFYHCYHKY